MKKLLRNRRNPGGSTSATGTWGRRLKDRRGKGSLRGQNVLEITWNERVRGGPVSRLLNVLHGGTVEESPRRANRPGFMSSKPTRNESFRTSYRDALDKPSGDRGLGDGLKRLNGWDKQRGRGPLVLGTVQIPFQGSDRTPHFVCFNGREGRDWRQENLHRLRRRRLILGNEVWSRHKTDTIRFPANMTRLNREGMKRTDHDSVTQSDGHKKRRLNGQTMKTSLVKRFKWRFWKSPKNHREAPGRQQSHDWGTLQKEGPTQSGEDRGPWNRRSVLKTLMTGGYHRMIGTNGRYS